MADNKQSLKVLIVIADVAAGHRSGAQALEEAFLEEFPAVEVTNMFGEVRTNFGDDDGDEHKNNNSEAASVGSGNDGQKRASFVQKSVKNGKKMLKSATKVFRGVVATTKREEDDEKGKDEKSDVNPSLTTAQLAEKLLAGESDVQLNVKTVDIFKEIDVQPFHDMESTHVFVSSNGFAERVFDVIVTTLMYVRPIYILFYNFFQWRVTKEFKRYLDYENADIVISVHPFSSMALTHIKKQDHLLDYKTATMITDLVTIFPGWADYEADVVFSPTASATNILLKNKVQLQRVKYPIFPIKPSLKDYESREKVAERLGLSLNKPTVLLTGGGLGVMAMEKAVATLAEDENLQMIVLAGKSEYLQRKLKATYADNPGVKVLGFVENIQDYYNFVDIIVTKPGPATILEAELFDKYVVLTKRVGIQEAGNIQYALTNPKFRYIGRKISTLRSTIDKILLEIESNGAQKKSSKSRRKFNESNVIARSIVELLAE
jgi:UDP-N-acetylglucosamine:LPS N-acetylglucosamine transferase